MLFQVAVTIKPVPGGWDDDLEERLVASIGVEAKTYSEAIEKLRKQNLDLSEFEDTTPVNSRRGT